MLSRKAQIREFLKTILSDGITEIEEAAAHQDWEATKTIVQEARDLGYISFKFKEKDYLLGPEKIINITVTMKGEHFCKGRS